jgi:hypothetical protein
VSTLNVNTVEPAGATLTIGASGDTVKANDSVNVNTVKDAGGNTIWVSNGSGVLSSVNSGFGDALKLLTTNTQTDVASFEFTSGIDSTYKEYIFKFINIHPETNDKPFGFQVDTGGGYGVAITDTAFEAQHGEGGAGAALNYASWQDAAQSTGHIVLASALGSGNDESASGEFHLFNPASTTYVKNFYATFQSYYENDYSRNAFTAGYVNTTSAVTGIKFYMAAGNLNGKIKMYGVL